MALLTVQYYSKTLSMQTRIMLILPQSDSGIGVKASSGDGQMKTLYLLHGMSDDESIWLRRTSIERYADETGIAVIMPTTQLGFYTDNYRGLDWWQYIAYEVPEFCREMFPKLSRRREDTYVAGLSMGGYGALKCALRAPEIFSRAAAFSAVCDVAELCTQMDIRGQDYWENIFGPLDQIYGSFNDLFTAAEDLKKRHEFPPPKLYIWCGREDYLFEQNCRFRDHLRSLHYPLTWEESAGDHQWVYWDQRIDRVIHHWLPL